MTPIDPVQEFAEVLKSLNAVADRKSKPNLYTLAERVRWLQMAIASTRLDMQRQKGEMDMLRQRVERLSQKIERDYEPPMTN